MTSPLSPSEVYYPQNIQHNTQSIYYIKSTSSSIIGITAGILGLTNLIGFSFYFVSFLLVGLLIWFKSTYFSTGGKQRGRGGGGGGKKVAGGLREYLIGGMLENLFSYILFWTLFYSLCHIYD